ncbi:MAG: cupin domain-containing protein [Dehalococcoidia bacterium]
MAEAPGKFQEPKAGELAGTTKWKRPASGYELFMQEEGIPVHRGIGAYDVRNLTLGPWKRLGGRGIFLCLDGLAGVKGMYVVEVPAAGVLNAERHVYDEFFYVVEGRGSTEVWREGSNKKRAFEWQAGSLFTAPINTWHRLVNASSSPALLLAATNAPPIMDMFQSRKFIFENPFEFTDRYDESEDFFKPKEDLVPHSINRRAVLKTNLIPDIVRCELPLDNQRAPGYRRIEPGWSGFGHEHTGFISQYPSGRYSKAHYHQSGAVLVCLRGKGYSINWRREYGTHPWESGNEAAVRKQEYIPGGLVAAAPGGGDWFHQHFGIGKEPLRVINFWGGPRPRLLMSDPGDEVTSGNLNIEEGGHSIDYRLEDLYVRKAYQEALKREGVEFQMPESVYR